MDVTTLVPGDLIDLRLGDIVLADIRLLEVTGLECDESVLTGESLPVAKSTRPVPPPATTLASCPGALMGTMVHADSGLAIVRRDPSTMSPLFQRLKRQLPIV